jgi:6-phosphogluconolactonase
MKLLPLAAMFLCAALAATAADLPFYVGTYTKEGGSRGIYLHELNPDTGAISEGKLVAELPNPTFLDISPDGKNLYAVAETNKGSVAAFAIREGGELLPLNEQSARGSGPCHVSVDRAGKYVFVANYGGGSVAALPIQEGGKLGEATGFVQHTGSSVNPQRQKQPNAHAIYPDAESRFVYVCDLGLDQVLVYRLDAEKGTLTPHEPPFAKVPPGSGPRHLALHPRGFAYVLNELLSTVTTFKHDVAAGTLAEIETVSTLPPNYKENNSTAEIFIHPNGKFLYASNRGHDSIVAYAIGEDGKLQLIGHTPTGGKTPRNFALDPSGRILLAANQQTDDIHTFKIDQATGQLSATGQSLKRGAPVCIVFPPQK